MIIKRFVATAIAISVSITSAPARTSANPVVLAPIALCSTGVGCVLVGTILIAGATYYIWQYAGKRKVIANAKGQIFRHTAEPGDFEQEQAYGTASSNNKPNAIRQCREIARQEGFVYIDVQMRNGKYVCIGVKQ